jgi:hypothetical protein
MKNCPAEGQITRKMSLRDWPIILIDCFWTKTPGVVRKDDEVIQESEPLHIQFIFQTSMHIP